LTKKREPSLEELNFKTVRSLVFIKPRVTQAHQSQESGKERTLVDKVKLALL